ncbi:DUF4388 domain-containing protein [Pleurocapsa sp. PCC 7327]|uniref:DUF4388 domain-containing protein n=1 Tax=Pleurocapsa sp. PCC 7327 TaxID=118163 RepID=UPI00164106FB|nr:DUF4388 domain-containing protein [Pleurocapsa sp. PCC 7327]
MSGSLETFSLPELFRLIDLGTKTGRLTVQPLPNSEATRAVGAYYIWFQNGRLVAITNRQDSQGLMTLIENRGWLSRRVIEKLAELCPLDMSFGVYLKTMGVLKAEQLCLLFQMHLHQVYRLFEVTSGWFVFEVSSPDGSAASTLTMPWFEMTGIGMRAMEVALLALRLVRHWDGYIDKLPELGCALASLVRHPPFRLDALELEIWKLANGSTVLEEIAYRLAQSSFVVQRTAFRLIMGGLVEEVTPNLPTNGLSAQVLGQERANSTEALADKESIAATVSQEWESDKSETNSSLFENLVSFLRSKF